MSHKIAHILLDCAAATSMCCGRKNAFDDLGIDMVASTSTASVT